MRVLLGIERIARIRIIVTGVVLISCASLGFYLDKMTEEPGSSSPINGFHFPSLEELYPEALDQARIWNEDAYMIWANMHFRDPIFNVAFAFNTSDDPNVGLLVYFRPNDEGTFDVDLEEVKGEGRTESRPEINRQDWEIDSVEVAERVYKLMGAEFLEVHPEADEALLQLTRLSGSAADDTGLEVGRIVWAMHYFQLRGYNLRVFVDPRSGEIIGEQSLEPLDEGDLQLNSN